VSDDDGGRVRLNLRVDEDVKNAFNEEIRQTFGQLRPYAGVELEREFRYFLDGGDITDLKAAIDDLATLFDESSRKEKIRETQRDTTTVVGYRIAESTRESMINAANDDYRSAGELIEAIMYQYATEGSAIRRITRKIQRVLDNIDSNEDKNISARERRTRTIAGEIDQSDMFGFGLSEFNEAIETAQGISSSDYTRKQYLPRVLNELGYTWDPEDPEWFISRDASHIPSVRDPTKKPYILMDKSDKRLAIKIAAYRNIGILTSDTFSISDAVDALGGQVRKTTVRPLMQNIAASSPGYQYDSEKNKLVAIKKKIREGREQNNDVLAIEHGENFSEQDLKNSTESSNSGTVKPDSIESVDTDKSDIKEKTPEVEYTSSNKEWLQKAIDLICEFCEDHEMPPDEAPQAVLENRIVRAKKPELFDEEIGLDVSSLSEHVSESEREAVLSQVYESEGLDDIWKPHEESTSEMEDDDESKPVTADGGTSDDSDLE
jgi:hypothetical protein